jgi:hypothetical protein
MIAGRYPCSAKTAPQVKPDTPAPIIAIRSTLSESGVRRNRRQAFSTMGGPRAYSPAIDNHVFL